MKDDFVIAGWSFAVQEAHRRNQQGHTKLDNGVKQEHHF